MSSLQIHRETHCHNTPVRLDAKFQTACPALLDVVDIGAIEIEEDGHSSRHELEKDRDDEVSNADCLLVVQVLI